MLRCEILDIDMYKLFIKFNQDYIIKQKNNNSSDPNEPTKDIDLSQDKRIII